MILPPHAYVPGHTPRHPEARFAALRATARPGTTAAALAQSQAFRTGLHWLDQGYYWEAHELLEPVWMALPPGSADRALVQALIQIANCGLKARMGKPRAVARLATMVRAHLALAGGARMGISLAEAEARLARILTKSAL